ncbi:hypothetical protein KI387_038381, partial [Taxus chinensis]
MFSLTSDPYKPTDALALEIYKNALDPMNVVFLRRAPNIGTLALAYMEAILIDEQLHPSGYASYYQDTVTLNTNLNEPLANQPVLNVLPISYANPVNDNVVDNSKVVAPVNTAQANKNEDQKNSIDSIQKMVQKLGNDFINLQRQ